MMHLARTLSKRMVYLMLFCALFLCAFFLASPIGVRIALHKAGISANASGGVLQGLTLDTIRWPIAADKLMTIEKATLDIAWWPTLRDTVRTGHFSPFIDMANVTDLKYQDGELLMQWASAHLEGKSIGSQWHIESLLATDEAGSIRGNGVIDWRGAGQAAFQIDNIHLFTQNQYAHSTVNGQIALSQQCPKWGACDWQVTLDDFNGQFEGQAYALSAAAHWIKQGLSQAHLESTLGNSHAILHAHFDETPDIDWDIALYQIRLPNHPRLYQVTSKGRWQSTGPNSAELALSLTNQHTQSDLHFHTDTLQFKKRKWVLSGSGTLGEGHFNLDGSLSWPKKGPLTYEFALDGKLLALSNTPFMQIHASPTLYLSQKAGQPFDLSGEVLIESADIRLQSTRSDVVHSEDVTIDRPPLVADLAPEPSSAPQPASTGNLSVAIDFGQHARFKGFGLSTALNGKLHLKRSANTQHLLFANGSIGLQDGIVEAYGKQFNLIKSSVFYHEQLLSNPHLAIRAEQKIKVADQLGTQVVGVEITGPCSRNAYAALWSA